MGAIQKTGQPRTVRANAAPRFLIPYRNSVVFSIDCFECPALTWNRRFGSLALAFGVWAAGALLLPAAVRAEEQLYESQRVDVALSARGLAIDPAPGSKRIAFISVAREDVFVGGRAGLRCCATTWPNNFRFMTHEDVIRRELLLAVGDRYDESRIEETMRNLRALGIFALVRIVPVQSREPDSVGLLVYTRDLWSLRLETDFHRHGRRAQPRGGAHRAQPVRPRQGAGDPVPARSRSRSVSARRTRTPALLGGDLTLDQSFDVIFNREQARGRGQPRQAGAGAAVPKPRADAGAGRSPPSTTTSCTARSVAPTSSWRGPARGPTRDLRARRRRARVHARALARRELQRERRRRLPARGRLQAVVQLGLGRFRSRSCGHRRDRARAGPGAALSRHHPAAHAAPGVSRAHLRAVAADLRAVREPEHVRQDRERACRSVGRGERSLSAVGVRLIDRLGRLRRCARLRLRRRSGHRGAGLRRGGAARGRCSWTINTRPRSCAARPRRSCSAVWSCGSTGQAA